MRTGHTILVGVFLSSANLLPAQNAAPFASFLQAAGIQADSKAASNNSVPGGEAPVFLQQAALPSSFIYGG